MPDVQESETAEARLRQLKTIIGIGHEHLEAAVAGVRAAAPQLLTEVVREKLESFRQVELDLHRQREQKATRDMSRTVTFALDQSSSRRCRRELARVTVVNRHMTCECPRRAGRRALRCGWLLLLVPPLVLAGVTSTHAPEVLRAGRWQFTAEPPALPFGFSLPSGVQGQPGGASFTSCIDPALSVPTDPRLACTVDGMNRSGTTITWATTCSILQDTFRSEGVAQYSGDTMSGTMTTRVPVLGQLTQRISGRYLGPCI